MVCGRMAGAKRYIVKEDRRRRSVRLPDYDYAQAGAYFVTICTHHRQLFFQHEAIRAIAERCWLAIPDHFPQVILDEWVVMPNHIHGMNVFIDQLDDLRHGSDDAPNANHRRGVQLNAPTAKNTDDSPNPRTGDDTVD